VKDGVEHESGEGEPMKTNQRFGQTFIVTRQSAEPGSPCEGAFHYLPALTHLAGPVERDASKWVRALAIYPRNELLKDQISETLFQLSRINPMLRAAGVRPLRVGTLFGPTPKSKWKVEEVWKLRPDGSRVCPFLACPRSGCDSPLVWKGDDIQAGIERVSCPKCGHEVKEDEIVLTRDGLVHRQESNGHIRRCRFAERFESA